MTCVWLDHETINCSSKRVIPFTTTIVITDGFVVKPYTCYHKANITRMSCNVMGPMTLLYRALLQHPFWGGAKLRSWLERQPFQAFFTSVLYNQKLKLVLLHSSKDQRGVPLLYCMSAGCKTHPHHTV